MSYNKESDKLYECITPEEILRPLGMFDLDPCAPVIRPWDMARHHFTIEDNGLMREWFGRCWVNPPYGRQLHLWIAKMNLHRNGICLIPSRTGSPWFHRQVYEQADGIYYLEDRIWFRDIYGNKILAKSTGKPGNCGHDSILIPYGKLNIEAIMDSGLKGHMELLRFTPVIVISVSGSWKDVVTMVVSRAGGEADLEYIYEQVDRLAPDKTGKNKNWKAKVRQKLQYHLTRIAEGRYTNKAA